MAPVPPLAVSLPPNALQALAYVLILAGVHIIGNRFTEIMPRAVLSGAGGVAAGYAIVHVLPLLANGIHTLDQAPGVLRDVEGSTIFSVVLLGFLAYYGIEHMVSGGSAEPDRKLFRIQVASFGLYNVLVGYLVTRPHPLGEEVTLFVVALAFHFVTTDHGFHRHHPNAWCHEARWFLGANLLVGYAVGLVLHPHPIVPTLAFAFLAGGILFNALNEEVPPPSRVHLVPFVLGAVLYTALLMWL